jgi:hypothetical protein
MFLCSKLVAVVLVVGVIGGACSKKTKEVRDTGQAAPVDPEAPPVVVAMTTRTACARLARREDAFLRQRIPHGG